MRTLFLALCFVSSAMSALNYNAHVFFYLWYGNPQTDGQYTHWNHKVLPHWRKEVNDQYSNIGVSFEAPESIHAPFYPLKGCYSSRDENVIDTQMQEIAAMEVGVIALSWWGRQNMPGTTDTQGVHTDKAMPAIFAAAQRYGVRVAFHLEPYPGRTVETLLEDIKYLQQEYARSSSMFRLHRGHLGFVDPAAPNTGVPLFYVYDSYHIPYSDWARLLTTRGDLSVRGTANDGIFLALYTEERERQQIVDAGFDGVYTYFAVDGMTEASRSSRWEQDARFFHGHGLLFVPSAGPGYHDEKIRPWNTQNTRDRGDQGEYYEKMLDAAISSTADIISITSWNEWGEGTQIEPAVCSPPGNGAKTQYLCYPNNDPYFFTNTTLRMSRRLGEVQLQRRRGGRAATTAAPQYHRGHHAFDYEL